MPFPNKDGTPFFPDYGWAELFTSTNTPSALLFTARTKPSPANIVPGNGLPAPAATLNPASVPIQNGTTWSPLGGSSGACYGGVGNGCGNSGWVNSNYVIPTACNYFLEIGVTNWADTELDTGIAMDGVTVGGKPITGVPEPTGLATLGSALLGLALVARKLRPSRRT